MATDFAPWSVSKAKTAYNCTLQFHWRYKERLKGRKIERAEGRIGIAVHQILERTLKGDDYEKAFRMAAIDAKLTRKEMLELATFRDAIFRFHDRFGAWCDKHDVDRKEDIFVEEELSITRDFKPTGYWDKDSVVRGLMDVGVRVRLNGKLYIVVIDHKTGRPREIDEFLKQLKIYSVMATAYHQEVDGVQPVIHWPRAEEPSDVFNWGPMWSREQIEDELGPWMLEYLAAANERGNADPVAVQGWYCDFCAYRFRCPLFGSEDTTA